MATRTDSSATWVQFGAGLLVGGALVLGTACAAIHVTDGWENVRGRSRGQASNGRCVRCRSLSALLALTDDVRIVLAV